nr:hypothetical protein [Thermus thermophilus]
MPGDLEEGGHPARPVHPGGVQELFGKGLKARQVVEHVKPSVLEDPHQDHGEEGSQGVSQWVLQAYRLEEAP